MKVKTTKICLVCNKEFKLYKTTDKYCSSACYYASNDKKLVKKQKPIKKFSKKRDRQNKEYLRSRKEFLALEENKFCPVAKKIFGEDIQTVEIHHKAGKIGDLLNYEPFWLAVSRKGHIWIHENPKEAYKLNFLVRSTTV